jgi:hypothetical protein
VGLVIGVLEPRGGAIVFASVRQGGNDEVVVTGRQATLDFEGDVKL